VIHIEELDIELMKTGSLTHDVPLEVRTRDRHGENSHRRQENYSETGTGANLRNN